MTRREFRRRNVEEILRDLEDRLRRIEQRTTVVVGNYVLEQNGTGQLQARHAMTGTVTVLANP
jgi:hypothetical protein